MKTLILITGAKGMLGTDLMAALNSEHECIGADIQKTNNICELDITNLSNVLELVGKLKPDLIINPAAYTNVDGCETEIDTAFKVNSIGAKNLAIASNEYNIPIVHISTDYVFNGEKNTPYIESDIPNPQSVYGQSKLDGENFVRQLSNKHYIVRIQWLYGLNGKNFVTTIIKAAREKGALKVVNDQWGSPTYTKDVAGAIKQLIKKPDYGTYHITNSGITTWHDFTQEILKQAGITGVTLTPCTTEEFPRPAKRPRYSPLDNMNWRLIGYEPLRPYQEALKDYIAELGEITNGKI